jgi:hypothetical protein
MVRELYRGKYQRALASNPFNPHGTMNEYTRTGMIMNFLYIDEEQKYHKYRVFGD